MVECDRGVLNWVGKKGAGGQWLNWVGRKGAAMQWLMAREIDGVIGSEGMGMQLRSTTLTPEALQKLSSRRFIPIESTHRPRAGRSSGRSETVILTEPQLPCMNLTTLS